MQDDLSVLGAGFQGLARQANVAANGRWGMLAMSAISLHQGQPGPAFLFALVLLMAYMVEQIPPHMVARRVCEGALTAYTLGLVLAFGWILFT